jgi:hypothetical protein
MQAFCIPTEGDNDADAHTPEIAARDRTNAPPPMITDEQRDMIQTLAPGSGKSLQEICESYKIASLKELTFAQADSLINRLRELTKVEA